MFVSVIFPQYPRQRKSKKKRKALKKERALSEAYIASLSENSNKEGMLLYLYCT